MHVCITLLDKIKSNDSIGMLCLCFQTNISSNIPTLYAQRRTRSDSLIQEETLSAGSRTGTQATH